MRKDSPEQDWGAYRGTFFALVKEEITEKKTGPIEEVCTFG